jgi:hypothetical protein
MIEDCLSSLPVSPHDHVQKATGIITIGDSEDV